MRCGYVLPTCSVYRAVAETARAAAFDDNRFPPVTLEEAPHLEIELSILSLAQPIRPEEIEIGRHGLLISWHGRRGLLLPQVPVEHALGPHHLSGTNLPQSRLAAGCMAKRRDHRSLHGGSFRDKQRPVISAVQRASGLRLTITGT